MLSFLYTHCKKYKPSLLTISGIAGSAIGFVWGFDLQKLTPSGTLSPELMWQLRMFLTPILISLYFLTLLVITLYHYKKETEPDLAQRIIEGRKKSERLLKASSLDSTQVEILKLLFSQNMSTQQIADSLSLQLQTATYHLTELANLNMIILERHSKPIANYGHWPSLRKEHFSAWTLKQHGRKYLLDNKLVEA